VSVIESTHDDDISSGFLVPNSGTLVTGGSSGTVKLWRKFQNKSKNQLQLKLDGIFHGHSDWVTVVQASQEWAIIVSGSRDNSCIVWDLNRNSFIYSLTNFDGPIRTLSISPTTGDIVVVSETDDARCKLALYSINGRFLHEAICGRNINCVAFTTGIEGLVDNIIVGGGEDGCLYFWAAYDLKFLDKLPGHNAPITALSISSDNMQVATGDATGVFMCWTCKK